MGDGSTGPGAADAVDLLDQGALASGNGVAVFVRDAGPIVAGLR